MIDMIKQGRWLVAIEIEGFPVEKNETVEDWNTFDKDQITSYLSVAEPTPVDTSQSCEEMDNIMSSNRPSRFSLFPKAFHGFRW